MYIENLLQVHFLEQIRTDSIVAQPLRSIFLKGGAPAKPIRSLLHSECTASASSSKTTLAYNHTLSSYCSYGVETIVISNELYISAYFFEVSATRAHFHKDLIKTQLGLPIVIPRG